jgi:transcription elongation factor Elf1
MKRYTKKTFIDFNVVPSLFQCRKCKEERIGSGLSSNGGEWDAIVECGSCTAVIVFNIWEIPEFATLAKGKTPDYVRTEDEILLWKHNEFVKFYETMPECPRCKKKRFEGFRFKEYAPDEGFSCKKCGNDLLQKKNRICMDISYYKYKQMEVWRYEVVAGNENSGEFSIGRYDNERS